MRPRTAKAELDSYPCPPRGGRRRFLSFVPMYIHFYPRPPRGGRRAAQRPEDHLQEISIHALREEGDDAGYDIGVTKGEFLSTPSARRATGFRGRELLLLLDFYPRPPRGGRRRSCRCPVRRVRISIHALREEGDVYAPMMLFQAVTFLSTPSARRATWAHRCAKWWSVHFYPRPPRGGRPSTGAPVLSSW